jgi:hypothetical protein
MMTSEATDTPQAANAVGAHVDQGVRPVAWADDKVMAGMVGNCASDAAKTYWQRGNQFDRMMAEKLVHPLYDQAALDNARQAIYEAEAAQLTAPLRAKVEELEATERGAKVAFAAVVEQKREALKECARLRGLLEAAYADIRRATQATRGVGYGMNPRA